MFLTPLQTLITILVIALATALIRFLPFLLFPQDKEPPRFIRDLTTLLPPAVMGLLVVYCLKGVSLTAAPYGIPELIGVAATAGLHLWRRNTLLSIAAGTVVYMVLVRFVFV